MFEDPNLTLIAKRWYTSSVRIFDGSLMIIGGSSIQSNFYNTAPENSFEFFPRKEQTVRPSAFLERALPANLFPGYVQMTLHGMPDLPNLYMNRIFALPDGTIFMLANNQSIIYDIEANTETILPDVPNGVRVTNPLDGSAILLPLSPPDYVPEVLVCGGSNIDDRIQPADLSSQTPASSQCSRIMLTPEGIAKGWEVEQMLEGRVMNELLHVPNGQILIANGAQTGFPGFSTGVAAGSIPDPVGNSFADNAALIPSLYTPSAPLGQRISNTGMPNSGIARMYHSSITLTPQGNFLVSGSNPNNSTRITTGVKFPAEFRVQTLDPPFMSMARPSILSMPETLPFGQSVTVPISLPDSLNTPGANVQGTLRRSGFSPAMI